jgi:hypothetical protein
MRAHLNHERFLTLGRLKNLDQLVRVDQARGRDEARLISETQGCQRNRGDAKDEDKEERAKFDRKTHWSSLRIINS